MAVGLMMIGMLLGLGSAVVALVTGAGVGMALLAYVAGGMLGMGLGVVASLLPAPHRVVRKIEA